MAPQMWVVVSLSGDKTCKACYKQKEKKRSYFCARGAGYPFKLAAFMLSCDKPMKKKKYPADVNWGGGCLTDNTKVSGGDKHLPMLIS